MNLYGYWQYDDSIGLGADIEKHDLVFVFKIADNMAYAVNEKGRVILFHKTHITKKGFSRPSYEYHKKCSVLTRSKHFYTLHDDANGRHKNECHKCQMYKFKRTVKKFKLEQEIGDNNE